MRILVTGATGTLGRQVVPVLRDAGHKVVIMSRRAGTDDSADWRQADLATGDGLANAVDGVDVVAHLASSPYKGKYTQRVDVDGTARLVEACDKAQVAHVLFVSIVGIETCLAEGVKIISTFWDDPAPLCDMIHDAGGLHLHTVASASEAKRAVDAGVDVVVAQGAAAGGIADGRGLTAVLALGADAAWMGTRFLLAEEADIAEIYRERLIAAAETDTAIGIVFDIGWPDAPHRALRNGTVRAWGAGRPSTAGSASW